MKRARRRPGGGIAFDPKFFVEWPKLALAGLGPAMGWLFAVALGLHRHSERTVLLALVPIALGHAAAVAAVLAAVLALSRMLDATTLLRLAAIVLIGWALWHTLHHSTSA